MQSRADLRAAVQAPRLRLPRVMTTTEETAAALRAVLAEAGARVCPACKEQAAVRTCLNGAAASLPDAQAGAAYVWLCFECGHEEPDVN